MHERKVQHLGHQVDPTSFPTMGQSRGVITILVVSASGLHKRRQVQK